MHRWTRFVLRWKLLVGALLPLVLVGVALGIENPLLGLGAALFVSLAFAVGYAFIRYSSTAA